MAKEDLVPMNKRSLDEAKKFGQKGGKASGKSRRQKKALRVALKEAMSLPLGELDADMKKAIMKAANITDESVTVRDAVMGSLIRTACNGNSQMMKLLLDTIGESADIRLREKDYKLREKALQDDAGLSSDAQSVKIYLPDNERGDSDA